MSETEKIRVYRGLKGVHFDRSPTTYIDGRKGELRYWGYSIHDLAEHSTFEETAYLLLHGELPTAGQLQSFDAQLKAGRQLPAPVIDIISTTLKKGDSLTLVGFGTFEVRKRAARTGRNPKTGEELKIKASKVPAFKPGATLKGLVNGIKKK